MNEQLAPFMTSVKKGANVTYVGVLVALMALMSDFLGTR